MHNHLRSCPKRKAAILTGQADNARGTLRISLLSAAADHALTPCNCKDAR